MSIESRAIRLGFVAVAVGLVTAAVSGRPSAKVESDVNAHASLPAQAGSAGDIYLVIEYRGDKAAQMSLQKLPGAERPDLQIGLPGVLYKIDPVKFCPTRNDCGPCLAGACPNPPPCPNPPICIPPSRPQP